MSRSRTINLRLLKREKFRKTAAIFYTLIFGVYLIWRLTVFSEQNFGFSLFFYIAELLVYLLSVVSIFCCWTYRHREPQTPREGQTVDVFLPVYREPLNLIRLTVMAAKRIEYPHRVLLLDDGKREDIRQLAEEQGVIYLRREDSKGAKAGNMNHALRHSEAEFIFVLDADHIAQPEALHATLGFMEEPDVGLVQTPQEYYNTDALQYIGSSHGRLWHDQSRFFSISEGCKDLSGNASCLGTGVLYRRSALDTIGGFPEQTVTEDMHTSLLMHMAGLKTAYLNEPVAYGVASADLADYYRTRQRWAHGNLHVFHLEKPLRSRKLNLLQKFHYTELAVIYLEGWQQLMMFLIPVLALCFGWQPFEITPLNVAIILGLPLAMIVLHDEQGCGLNRAWIGQLFSIARMPIQLISWAGFFGKKIAWKPSAKNTEGVFDVKLILPQIALVAASLIGVIIGAVRLGQDFSVGPLTLFFQTLLKGREAAERLGAIYNDGYSLDLFLVSSFWALYNLARAAFWIYDTYRRSGKMTEHFRFKVPLILETKDGDLVKVSWISQSHMGVDPEWLRANPEKSHEGTLWLPGGPLELGFAQTGNEKVPGETQLKLRSSEDQDTLNMSIYSVDWHTEAGERDSYFPTILELVFGIFRPFHRPNHKDWKPALARYAGHTSYCMVSHEHGCSEMLGFGDAADGRELELTFPGGDTEHYILGAEQPLQGWCRKGLDGAIRWKRAIRRNAGTESQFPGEEKAQTPHQMEDITAPQNV
ncbi:MAG: cellulose synthase catalytic subunit [Luteolibacter sp.]